MSSVEKAELKIAIATDIGASIEDSLEAAKKDTYRQEGSITAFGQAAKACELLSKAVQADLDEGKIEDLAVAEAIKLWLSRAANANRNLGRDAENLSMAARGKVAALEGAVALIEKYRRVEELKIAASKLTTPVQAPIPVVVLDGGPVTEGRPSLKERRLAEERASAAAVPETVPEPRPTIVPPAKRRGRPKGKGSA